MKTEYAPIKAILLRDFRSIHEAVIRFNDSPIVSIVGDNEAGKSSFTKALQTIGANLNPNTQRDYIRTNTDGFMVAVKFDDPDDTTVVRVKSKGENGFRVQKGANIVWSVTKMDGSDVPPEIEKYTGFVIEPETKELLNIRTYEDLMVFIHTSSSTNYKVMYNALKVENLLRAKKLGQNEMNEHRRALNDAEGSVLTLTDELRKIKVIDLDPLLAVKKRVQAAYDNISEMEGALDVKDRLDKLDAETSYLKQLESVNSIDELLAYTLKNAIDTKEKEKELRVKLDDLDKINDLQNIDESTIKDILTARELRERLEDNRYKAYSEIENTQLINVDSIISLEAAVKKAQECLEKDREIERLQSYNIDTIDTSVIDIIHKALDFKDKDKQLGLIEAQYKTEIKQLEDTIKSMGVLVSTCPRCGETVIMENVV